jgi:hypothetical protein
MPEPHLTERQARRVGHRMWTINPAPRFIARIIERCDLAAPKVMPGAAFLGAGRDAGATLDRTASPKGGPQDVSFYNNHLALPFIAIFIRLLRNKVRNSLRTQNNIHPGEIFPMKALLQILSILLSSLAVYALQIQPLGTLPQGLTTYSENAALPWVVLNNTWRSSPEMPSYGASSGVVLAGPWGPGKIELNLSVNTIGHAFRAYDQNLSQIGYASRSGDYSFTLNEKQDSLFLRYVKSNEITSGHSDYAAINQITLPVSDTLRLQGFAGSTHLYKLYSQSQWEITSTNNATVSIHNDTLKWFPTTHGLTYAIMSNQSADSTVILSLQSQQNHHPLFGKNLWDFEEAADSASGLFCEQNNKFPHTGAQSLFLDWSKTRNDYFQRAPQCSLTVTTTGGDAWFWLKMNRNGDQRLCFYTDTTLQKCWWATTGWQQYSFSLPPGEYTLKWKGIMPDFGFLPGANDYTAIDDLHIPGLTNGSDTVHIQAGLANEFSVPIQDDFLPNVQLQYPENQDFILEGTKLVRTKGSNLQQNQILPLQIIDSPYKDTMWIQINAQEDEPVISPDSVHITLDLGDVIYLEDTLFTYSNEIDQNVSIEWTWEECEVAPSAQNNVVTLAFSALVAEEPDTLQCTITFKDTYSMSTTHLIVYIPDTTKEPEQLIATVPFRNGPIIKQGNTLTLKPLSANGFYRIITANGHKMSEGALTRGIHWTASTPGVYYIQIMQNNQMSISPAFVLY